jgi:uncharacterized cupredoxin-like copper-binding protein
MMAIKRTILLPALLLGTLTLAACGGQAQGQVNKAGGGAPGSDGQIVVKSTDRMRFEPANATVRVNTPVKLTLNNSEGALPHDWTIDNLAGQKVHVHAAPKQRATGEFTPTAAGTYQIYCAEPGHKEAGMVGTLTVN